MADSYLLTNGPIWTGDAAQPWAPAVVVRGRDLVYVGTRDAAQIEALFTRQRPGHPDEAPLVARQRIGLHDALRGYTANGAYQLRLDHRTGTITAGKADDLTVLGADLFRVDPQMMDGRITHDNR